MLALQCSAPRTNRGNSSRGLEDSEDHKAAELSVTSDFDAQTAVARELVLRLASLLWRVRRATAVGTGLLQIQSEILRKVRQAPTAQQGDRDYAVQRRTCSMPLGHLLPRANAKSRRATRTAPPRSATLTLSRLGAITVHIARAASATLTKKTRATT